MIICLNMKINIKKQQKQFGFNRYKNIHITY